jgi:hypothetical protein
MNTYLLRVEESDLAYAGQPMLVIGYFLCSLAIIAVASLMIASRLKRLGGELE